MWIVRLALRRSYTFVVAALRSPTLPQYDQAPGNRRGFPGDRMPGQWGADLVEADRRHERTERTFSILWLVVGGALLGAPLFMKRRVWQLGWRMNGLGCGIAAGGLLLSGMGALVCVANGLKQNGDGLTLSLCLSPFLFQGLSLVGLLGVLAGAIVAIVGSIMAVAGRSKA